MDQTPSNEAGNLQPNVKKFRTHRISSDDKDTISNIEGKTNNGFDDDDGHSIKDSVLTSRNSDISPHFNRKLI